jgi:mono/diheme cytochrome c family protein
VTHRRALAYALAGAALAALAAGAVALVRAPLPTSPRGPEPGRSLFQTHCATCHGPAGRGDSWRARLLFLRPGNLADPATASLPDQYLADMIRHGGSTFGKPGMPSFGFVLGEQEIDAVIQYVRSLPRTPPHLGDLGTEPAARGPDGSGEYPRVEVANRDQLHAFGGAPAGPRDDPLGGHRVVPVRLRGALRFVPPPVILGRARPLPPGIGRARRAAERQERQEDGPRHVWIVPPVGPRGRLVPLVDRPSPDRDDRSECPGGSPLMRSGLPTRGALAPTTGGTPPGER